MVPSRFRSVQNRVDSPPRFLTSTTPMTKARKTKAGSYELTERQSQVLRVIRDYVKELSVPPTRSELAQALDLKHQSAVDNHLHALAKKGWVELKHGVERGIRLLREGVPLYEPEDFQRRSAGPGKLGEKRKEPDWIDYDLLWELFGETPDVCLRIRGDAMDNAGLTEGGIVALRLARDDENEEPVQEGDVVAARVRNEVVLRRYHRVQDRIVELQPESTNPDHQPIRIVTRVEDIEIIGVVIGRVVRERS